MNANQMKSMMNKAEAGISSLDLEALGQGIWRDLCEKVDLKIVRQVLADLLPKYQEARVLSYVPIQIRRDVVEILRRRSE